MARKPRPAREPRDYTRLRAIYQIPSVLEFFDLPEISTPYRLVSALFLFTCDATVDDRLPRVLVFDGSGTPLLQVISAAIVTASSVRTQMFATNLFSGVAGSGPAGFHQSTPLPWDLVVMPGQRCRLGAINANAGDTLSAVTVIIDPRG